MRNSVLAGLLVLGLALSGCANSGATPSGNARLSPSTYNKTVTMMTPDSQPLASFAVTATSGSSAIRFDAAFANLTDHDLSYTGATTDDLFSVVAYDAVPTEDATGTRLSRPFNVGFGGDTVPPGDTHYSLVASMPAGTRVVRVTAGNWFADKPGTVSASMFFIDVPVDRLRR